MAIRQDDVPLLKRLDLQLNRQVLWNAKVNGTWFSQSRDLNGMEVLARRIAKLDDPSNQTHGNHHQDRDGCVFEA